MSNKEKLHVGILGSLGKACKRYLRMVKNLGKDAVPRQPCPYEDCTGNKVWFWGWFERKKGAIPLSAGEVADAIPLRRFQCQGCKRCFSWRPPFLAFARRFAAVTYQRALKAIALDRKLALGWYEFSPAGFKAFRLTLEDAQRQSRLRGWSIKEWPELWFWLKHQTKNARDKHPQLAIHILCLGLARHPDGARYRLNAN